MAHLLVALTAHGFGHIAQAAPVVNALRRQRPGLTVTVYSASPKAVLAQRFDGPFDHYRAEADAGMVMHDALRVDPQATAAAYASWHSDWPARVDAAGALLRQLAPDEVFADCPYTILQAAADQDIPAIALCSLHWGAVYRHYVPGGRTAAAIYKQINQAYRSARCFLAPTPSMPMPELDNRHTIGPVAALGRDRRRHLLATLGRDTATRLVLLGFGGVPVQLPLDRWPARADIHWLVPDAPAHRSDMSNIADLGVPLPDLIRSVDTLLTKPGYGSFAEAVCNGTPILYVSRPDWPETPALAAWLAAHGRGSGLTGAELGDGALFGALDALWSAPPPAPVAPRGVTEAAATLSSYLPPASA